MSGGRGLVRIDLIASTAERVGDLTVVSAPPFAPSGLSYEGDLAVLGGTLYYASAGLFRVDRATAQATPVGPLFEPNFLLPKNYPGLVAAGDRLLGVDWMGQVASIDPATGGTTPAGNAGNLWIAGAAEYAPPASPPPLPPADLAAGQVRWDFRTGGLRVPYTMTGTVSGQVTGAVYWATAPFAPGRSGPPAYTFALNSRPGAREFRVPAEALRTPPPGATQLVVVLDAAGRVAETDETNNTATLALAVTGAQLRQLNPRLSAARAASFVAPLNTAMAEFGVRSAGQKAAFLAQLGHESTDLTRWEENLNYTTLAALRSAYRVFRTMPDAQAATYLRNPERLDLYRHHRVHVVLDGGVAGRQ